MKTNEYDNTIETILPLFEGRTLKFALAVLLEVKRRLRKAALISKVSS